MVDGLILTCIAADLTAVTWVYIEWHNGKTSRAKDNIESLSSGVVFKYRS